jgi:hypothetical protein
MGFVLQQVKKAQRFFVRFALRLPEKAVGGEGRAS